MKIPYTALNIILTFGCFCLLFPIISQTFSEESARFNKEQLKRSELDIEQAMSLTNRLIKLKGIVDCR
jgi:hypothetical protein